MQISCLPRAGRWNHHLSTRSRSVLVGLLLMLPAGVLAENSQPAVELPRSITIWTAGKSDPTLNYAVERTAFELQRVHGCRVQNLHQEQPPAVGADSGLIVISGAELSDGLRKWCVANQIEALPALAAEAYALVVQAKPLRVLVTGGDSAGAWYGCCAWLDALVTEDGKTHMPTGRWSEKPALDIRFTRTLRGGIQFKSIEDARESLDYWARWRMNVTRTDGCPNKLLPAFIAEAHLRGMRVVQGLGVRNLCAADDAAVASKAREFDSFLELGGDGIVALWDDLAHERCFGHCDACRKRFGENSLPREIAQVLEALCEVAARQKTPPLLIWCPSHYSTNRYPEMSDQDFFREVGKSPNIRSMTYVFFSEFAPERIAPLEAAGLTQRIWWYNGLRSMYQNCQRWPTEPRMKLDIPKLSGFVHNDFPAFEWGWKTGVGIEPDGKFIYAPAETWQNLRSVPERYQGFYYCGPTHPYHAAMGAMFSLSPQTFSQAQADRVVFQAMFGPQSHQLARQWSDSYNALQVRVAQRVGNPDARQETVEFQEGVKKLAELGSQLHRLADRKRSILPAAFLADVLKDIDSAPANLREVLQSLPTTTTKSGDANSVP